LTTDKATVALRVLTAINNRKTPEERDIFLLRLYCPEYRHCDPDELACFLLQESMQRKLAARNGGGQPAY
jgi:hypothetical protein